MTSYVNYSVPHFATVSWAAGLAERGTDWEPAVKVAVVFAAISIEALVN